MGLSARYTDLMLLDYIVSVNVARRHLNPGQKAMAALALEPMYAEAIKVVEAERRLREPRNQYTTDSSATSADLQQSHSDQSALRSERTAAAKAARVTGSSTRATYQAKTVKRDAPDLAEKVTKPDPG